MKGKTIFGFLVVALCAIAAIVAVVLNRIDYIQSADES